MSSESPRYRLLPVFTGFFVACLIISNVASAAKIVAIGELALPAGAIVFPISYIFGDILTEVYGYAQSRRVIWTGFGCLLLAVLVFYIGQLLPGAAFFNDQAAYEKVLGFVPRIVAGSMTAYFFGEFCNSWVVSKMKYRSNGRRGASQASRFLVSTIVGEAVDSVIFIVVAFGGVISIADLMRTGITLYAFKVVYEIIALPISVPFANWVKCYEGVDRIDCPETTSYNPFTLSN